MPGMRQEFVNVLLAELLQERGLVTEPELILRSTPDAPARIPDVLVDFQGLRLAIEAEFGMTRRAARAAYEKALQRVDSGIAHIGLAVQYPLDLTRRPFAELKDALAASTIAFSIVKETDINVTQTELFPRRQAPIESSFLAGSVDDLGEALRRSYGQLIQDEVLDRAVETLETRIATFVSALTTQPAATERFARVLGIGDLPNANRSRQLLAIRRIGGLIIVNALSYEAGFATIEVGNTRTLVSKGQSYTDRFYTRDECRFPRFPDRAQADVPASVLGDQAEVPGRSP